MDPLNKLILNPRDAVRFATIWIKEMDKTGVNAEILPHLDRAVQILSSLPEDCVGNRICPGDTVTESTPQVPGYPSPTGVVYRVTTNAFWERRDSYALEPTKFKVITEAPSWS